MCSGMSSLMRWEEVQSYPLELERKRYDLQHEAAAIAVTTIVIQWKAPRTSFGQLFPWYENGEGMRHRSQNCELFENTMASTSSR